MKIAFFSNYLNHHQLSFCKEMVKLTNNNFSFVCQKAISEKRISLGYQNISEDYDFVIRTYESKEELNKAYKLADEADYVLFGSSDVNYLNNRLNHNKLTIKYSERLFKKPLKGLDYLRAFHRVYVNHGKYRNKELYMLCAGMYSAYDFNRFGAYKNKTYKWGYFPEAKEYDLEELFAKKDDNVVNIVWAGRLIDWKHPELVIELGKRLKDDGFKFVINIIGQGEMENELVQKVKEYELLDCVHLLGSMTPDEVRKHMEKASIHLFTSDKQEGWGAVLNEAMNSGCACVASHAIGSVGFLINHNENGLIYKDGDFEDLYNKVKSLLNDPERRYEIAKNSYKTITELWNAKVAAKRFVELCQLLSEGKDTPFESGPCSKAYPIKEEEMYDYLVKK